MNYLIKRQATDFFSKNSQKKKYKWPTSTFENVQQM